MGKQAWELMTIPRPPSLTDLQKLTKLHYNGTSAQSYLTKDKFAYQVEWFVLNQKSSSGQIWPLYMDLVVWAMRFRPAVNFLSGGKVSQALSLLSGLHPSSLV